ncbi:MAG: patatin-like phospholipase family protein [Acidobacteriales bacterium]|nr:patatin-like phospholipase family protein [Terriglobales bacterium]
MKRLGKIIRSVQAFGREVSGRGDDGREAGIGIALGGGFARGIAHIGVLKVLEEENIPIRYISGTSVGALIGAAYCSGVTSKELEEIALRVRFKHFARWTLSRYGFASNQRMIGFLNSVLKVKTFEELQIPLAVTATDFSTGEGVVFHSGPLVDPVRASCAYPGMFLPVKIRGRLLVDGMLAHAVPTVPVRAMGADRVLAVHLRATWVHQDGPRHLFDVIGQCFAIAQEMNCGVWRQAADLVIEPDVSGYKYDDFERATDMVRAGETATRAALPEIRKWLETHPAASGVSHRQAGLPQTAAVPAE